MFLMFCVCVCLCIVYACVLCVSVSVCARTHTHSHTLTQTHVIIYSWRFLGRRIRDIVLLKMIKVAASFSDDDEEVPCLSRMRMRRRHRAFEEEQGRIVFLR